ncbi:NADH:ubiquinone oxidoreductase [Rhodotorula toruloides]
MAGDGVDDPSFTSPSSALTHYRTLCTSLQSQLQSAEDDLRDLRELQDELERELERFEEGERGMRGEVEGLREEREEWKSKYLLALSSHSSTITHMQKELESLRLTERGLRNKLREVEVDNDDLEGRERATSSSLADLEARYNKSLERIALLEEELVGKARLEEEVQRARDELRAHRLERDTYEAPTASSNSFSARLAANSHNRVCPTYARFITHDSYDLGFSIEASSPAFVLLLLGLGALTPPLPLLLPNHHRLTLQASAIDSSPVNAQRHGEHDPGDAGYDWSSEAVDGTVGSGSGACAAEGRGEGESEFGELECARGGRRDGRGRGRDDEEFDYALACYHRLATIKSARLAPPSANAIDSPTFTLRPPRLDRLVDSSTKSAERLLYFDLDERDKSSCVAYARSEAEFEARRVGKECRTWRRRRRRESACRRTGEFYPRRRDARQTPIKHLLLYFGALNAL